MREPCSHLDQIEIDLASIERQPGTHVCQQCVDMGDTWVNLRMCLTCGQVGCCDDSKNRHATAHYHATDHPLITALTDGKWIYCYIDDVGLMP